MSLLAVWRLSPPPSLTLTETHQAPCEVSLSPSVPLPLEKRVSADFLFPNVDFLTQETQALVTFSSLYVSFKVRRSKVGVCNAL